MTDEKETQEENEYQDFKAMLARLIAEASSGDEDAGNTIINLLNAGVNVSSERRSKEMTESMSRLVFNLKTQKGG